MHCVTRLRDPTSRGTNEVCGMIAAIAVANDLSLVTRNSTDFKDFTGLRVESWFE